MAARPHPDLTPAQVARLLRTPYDALTSAFPGHPRRWLVAERNRLRALQPVTQIVTEDSSHLRAQATLRDHRQRYEAALRANVQLQERLDALSVMPPVERRDLAITSRAGKREAVAVALASDWHAEEKVTKEQTNGLNEYNLDLFNVRARWFFRNVAKLVDKEARAVEIQRLVLWLGGDMISGGIHEDLAESNQLGPIDALVLVQDVIAGGIAQLLRDLPGVELTVVVSAGNHSRITDRQRVQTEHAHSLEWLLGAVLAREFRAEPRAHFLCERAYHAYLDVLGYTLRFHHGHAMRYAGGVGGLTIPANRAISEWNKGRRAYLDVFGHFHTLFFGPDFVVNGSLIGCSPYSISIRAPYQRPQQAFFLIDSAHGLTVRAPILLEDA